MSESLFSPSWYRVAKLKPKLRGHGHVYRHTYRGELWYVLQDHARSRYYRFSPTAYHVIGQMNGKHTVQELWESACERFGDDAPTQQDVVQLLSQLHGADMLLSNVPSDTAELLRRSKKVERAKWGQRLRSPMALRFPLVDPENFLSRTVFLVRPLFGVFGAVLWLAVVAAAVVMAGLHWSELTENVVDRVLSAQNLVVLWLAYPFVKILHELGHGYAVKVWGGEVHEMGVMLLVLMPIPYVDASAASQFPVKHRRLVVGAAGILVELFVASLALFLWIAMGPGLVRSVAFNVILIGSVSTLLFNGNPLLRFDGYYIFSDLVEIPNLAQRGTSYLGYLWQRYVFRAKPKPPHTGPGERGWFVVYTISAFVYRAFVYVAIVLFIAGKFFFIGVILAMWAAYSMAVAPLVKGLKYVASSPALRDKRPRAVLLTAATILVLLVLVLVVPFPLRTRTEGVVWVPEESLVRAGTGGFVRNVAVESGASVAKDEVVVECWDPLLMANARVLRAQLEELQSRYDAALVSDRVQVKILREEIEDVRREIARAEERLNALELRSPIDGAIVTPRAQDLPGRYVRQGELLAYVLDVGRPTIRVVVPQSNVDLVRRRTRDVEVRLAERLDRAFPAVIKREVPEAAGRLPSTALGSAGGGEIAIDPSDSGGTRTFETLFQFDLELEQPLDEVFVGGRVYVRFDHGWEPLAHRWYRSIRQLFLKRFNV